MARRKSIFDRYNAIQLKTFEEKYKYNLAMGLARWIAAGAAGMDVLYTVKEWNSVMGTALYDDALACAGRIDAGLFLEE